MSLNVSRKSDFAVARFSDGEPNIPGPRKIGTSQTQFTNAKAPGIEAAAAAAAALRSLSLSSSPIAPPSPTLYLLSRSLSLYKV